MKSPILQADTKEQEHGQQERQPLGNCSSASPRLLRKSTIAQALFAVCTLSVLGFTVGGWDVAHRYRGPGETITRLTLATNQGLPTQNRTASLSSAGRVELFVGVISACANQAKREGVRQTWGSDPRLARVVFVVSRPTLAAALDRIRQEALDKQDVIFVDHVEEHYLNITYQSLEVFRAAHAYHGPITHVLKCDDDSYIHVSRMLAFLEKHPFKYSWAGNIAMSYEPIRDPGSKGFVSKEEWPEDYSSIKWSIGPGYVLTMDLVQLLATGGVARCAPGPLFKLEDVAVGSWLTCLEREQNITINLARSSHINGGSCASGDLVSHYMRPNQMRCMFSRQGECCNTT